MYIIKNKIKLNFPNASTHIMQKKLLAGASSVHSGTHNFTFLWFSHLKISKPTL